MFATSSAGRLFDAVSALLNICTKVTYEGQAAIELESCAYQWLTQEHLELSDKPRYPITWTEGKEGLILRIKELYLGIIQDILAGREKGYIAYHFHNSLAHGILETVRKLQSTLKSEKVVENSPIVLSGGVFQNKLLTENVLELCAQSQISVLRSRELPPGDGGLAFGQVLIANER